MDITRYRARHPAVEGSIPRVAGILGLIASLLIFITGASFSHAQEQGSPTESPRIILVLPENFKGWTCVDFGVAGAAPLPREGSAWIVRVRPGEDLKTSDRPDEPLIYAETRFETAAHGHSLPQGEIAQRQTHTSDSQNPVRRYCAFYGTVDEGELASDAPGFRAYPRDSAGVSEIEREALIALYKETNGDHWIHRVGWLGPPGTECNWHGVECWSGLNPRPQQVTGIDLMENKLAGAVPAALKQLTHLTDVNLLGNHLSGMLPQPLIQKWLAGTLQVVGEASLLTGISKIEYEVDPSALLCGFYRIELDADGQAMRYETRCRNATPDDRTTYCEVKEGKSWGSSFATLAWVLEKNGFFRLNPEYSGNMTDAAFVTTRATKSGALYSVEEYAFGAPFELSVVHLAIEGFASSRVEWERTTEQPKCPASWPAQKN